ncbi:hypothetical protein LTR37_008536 [Vermiconidia calcicola]|uniref:Uncharacterized protein n=1 Tax=Vermiconidia calcicola TaxID=1690605 RepID=A0ACC3NBU7_9PEZI|nr:hypothetical protein LTR37_008536 [Vermiconidia calcicola]
MRLRLRIERNGLPATQTLWPVKEAKNTLAQLLQQINDVFPLESDTWGLEDYSVSIGDYECLHYHEIAAVCKEDDELLIKALQYVEVRARTLTGRDQITSDGRHLMDGVPFGKPCLRAPVRPEVRIPPRKRRKLDEDDTAPLMLMEHGEGLDDGEEDEDEDEDFEMEESEHDDTSDDSSSEAESDHDETSDSDTSDSSSSESSSDETSDDGSEWEGLPTSSTKKPSAEVVPRQVNGVMGKASNSSPAGAKRKRASDDEGHAPKQGHEPIEAVKTTPLPFQGKPVTKDRNARRRDAKKLKMLKQQHLLPQDATLNDLRALDRAKDGAGTTGGLETNAGGAMQKSLVGEVDGSVLITGGKPVPSTARQTERLEDSHIQPIVVSDVAQQATTKAHVEVTRPERIDKERQKLLAAIDSGGIDITKKVKSKKPSEIAHDAAVEETGMEPPEELSSKQRPAMGLSSIGNRLAPKAVTDVLGGTKTNEECSSDVPPVDPPSATRRSQLDLAGSKRLLFGSLGVRVPKTQADRDRIQKKLAERPKRNASSGEHDQPGLIPSGLAVPPDVPTVATETAVEPGDEQDPEAWREKINLTAVECCEEGVTLSTPPFPFYQRWDPQQRKKKSGSRVSGTYMAGTKRKRKGTSTQNEETYDKYNTDGYGDYLDYDDADYDAAEADDEYWEEGALLDGDEEADDGFPILPADVTVLPTLSKSEAQKDDFILFNELACDESTEWQPKMVTRVAKLVEAPSAGSEDKTWTLQLSMRDRKPKVFDEEGNRVYSKFEMPDEESEEEDDGIKAVVWSELGDVRLLLRQEVEVTETDPVKVQESFTREKRVIAIKRRREEEDHQEAEKQERLQARCEQLSSKARVLE